MVRIKYILLIVVIVFFSLLSCNKKELVLVKENKVDDYNYLGNEKGRYCVYKVKHIIHDDEVDVHDTLESILKVYIGDTLKDNLGKAVNKMYRYIWNKNTNTWDILNVWTIYKDGNFGVVNEENQRLVKLLFPLDVNNYWNANRFNDNDSLTYRVVNLHRKILIDNILFDSTLTVEQENYFTLVDFKRKNEVYAKGIGLISKYYKDLRIKNFDSTKVQKGEEWYYTIKSFGKE